ncbi:ribonuclease P [Candidatus Woesearchaeota archaeon]|nr:ribonuclease P [Candidatus Woesearchaeota archaeon]
MKKHSKKPQSFSRIALERIEKLFAEADKQFKKDKKLSKRYVLLARKISMKYKVRIPSRLKKRFCRHCLSFLVPGVNARVRVYGNRVIYCCSECKGYMRFPYVREKKARKKTS